MAPSTAPALTAARLATDTVAIVEPHTAAYAETLTQRGQQAVAVTLAPRLRPPAHQDTAAAAAYSACVKHSGGLRRTVKELRARDVAAVLAGSEQGIELAERIAWHLGVPGSNPQTTLLRRDRGAQADALTAAGLAAPRGQRTASLAEAVAWAQSHEFPQYVLSPAAVGVPVDPVICRTVREISTAWRELRRMTHHYSGDASLVISEHVRGRRYTVNSITTRRWLDPVDQAPDHLITDIWSQTHTAAGLLDRADLMHRHDLLARRLSLYVVRALDALGIASGPVSMLLACEPQRGPLLLSASAVAGASLADTALRETTGRDRLGEAIDSVLPARPAPLALASHPQRVVRVRLNAAADGVIDPWLLRTIATLPTVASIDTALRPMAPVTTTTTSRAAVGEIVLSDDVPEAIEADYRVIRAVETAGLYQGR
ncbi:hypothetical protein [Streptomyces sp. NPDC097610]|uniref:hypothetical protein n=1 Tax=Streptomyces sp. NPDC097610 TaxID=3157227 RepID=UPI00331CDCDA